MMGFGGYGSSTKIGNWSEEIHLREEIKKSNEARRMQGGMLSQQILAKMHHHTTPVELTPEHPDGNVRFGDLIMLQCAEHNGFLCVDMEERRKIVGHPEKVIVTAAKADRPMLRNVWRIERVESADDNLYPEQEADVLHYTQPFKLELTTQLSGGAKPLSLYTEMVTGVTFSKISRNQEVSVVDRGTTGMVWKAVCIDTEYRIEMEGMPIKANSAILLHHPGTNQNLCSQTKNKYINDFGAEWEVCGYTDRGTGTKKKSLPEQTSNHWGFIYAPPVEGCTGVQKIVDRRQLSKQEALVVINKVKAKLLSKGGNGFRGLSRVLNILDDNGNRALDKYEMDNGLQTYGIVLHPSEIDIVMGSFDKDGNGQISVREFMTALRGPMSDYRKGLVRMAYQMLDVDGSGVVQFDEIKQLYDVKKHPDVLSGTKTPDMVLQEFIKAWNKDGDTTITFDEFLEYYEDLSAPIDSDDYFELMIRNAWHISGGKGVAQNTSCRRVLVTHYDGAQTIEEIKNDIRIPANDMEGMRKNLEAQGITGFKKFQLYS